MSLSLRSRPMQLPGSAVLSCLLLLLGLGSVGEREAAASFGPTAVPLRTFSPEQVRSLAPLLRQSDLTLLESEPGGKLRQVTFFTLVAAPPTLVRSVLLDAGKYTDFVRNFVSSKVTPRPAEAWTTSPPKVSPAAGPRSAVRAGPCSRWSPGR